MTVASYEQALRDIEQRLRANWTTTPIAVPNVEFDPAEPGQGFPANGPFVYHEVIELDGDYASLGAAVGNNVHRHVVSIMAFVFTPSGTGDGDSAKYARQIADIFRGQRFNGISCFGADISGGDRSDDSGLWWQRRVAIEANIDELA